MALWIWDENKAKVDPNSKHWDFRKEEKQKQLEIQNKQKFEEKQKRD